MPSHQNDGVFLTGATGFLGSALLHELIATGRQVSAIVRPQSKLDRIASLLDSPNLRLIDSSPDQLEIEFARRSIGVIIHAATEYGRGEVPIANILDANFLLPIRIAELGIKYGARSFINIDSFFNKNQTLYSNLPYYSLAKSSLVSWLNRLSQNICVVNTVLEHMYGPYDSRTKFVEMMIQDIAVARLPHVDLTHGHQRRDFIYISDVVSAIMALVDYAENNSFNFKTFGIGTGQDWQVRDFVSLISTISGSPTELRFGAMPYRPDEIMGSHADTRGLADLGWRAQVAPADGIKAILERYTEGNRP